jgi:hypothetical protein
MYESVYGVSSHLLLNQITHSDVDLDPLLLLLLGLRLGLEHYR